MVPQEIPHFSCDSLPFDHLSILMKGSATIVQNTNFFTFMMGAFKLKGKTSSSGLFVYILLLTCLDKSSPEVHITLNNKDFLCHFERVYVFVTFYLGL